MVYDIISKFSTLCCFKMLLTTGIIRTNMAPSITVLSFQLCACYKIPVTPILSFQMSRFFFIKLTLVISGDLFTSPSSYKSCINVSLRKFQAQKSEIFEIGLPFTIKIDKKIIFLRFHSLKLH